MKRAMFILLACSLFLNTTLARAQSPVNECPVVETSHVNHVTPAVPIPETLADQLDRVLVEVIRRDEAQKAAIAALSAQLKKHDEEPMWLVKMLTNPTTIAIVSGLVAGKFAIPD